MRNARFVVGLNDTYVKLTLRPDQTIRWSELRRTDEGWTSIYREWWYDAINQRIVRTIETDGVDCDGRMQHYSRSVARLNQLASFTGHDGVTMLPKWIYKEESQRDFTAESMGY